MIKLDLEQLLETNNKEGVLSIVEAEINKVLLKKQKEQHLKEARAKELRDAKARVADGTYTSETLAILQRALNEEKEQGQGTYYRYTSTPDTDKAVKEAEGKMLFRAPVEGRVLSGKELDEILKLL